MNRAPDEPLATIMIPAYNGARWLDETLTAATAQTHRNLRVLVSDGGSTDTTVELVSRAAELDSRIHLIREPHRLRWVANFNHLLDHVEGDYACFLMQDDLIVDHYVETLLAALRAQRDPALAYGDMATFDDRGLFPAAHTSLVHHLHQRVWRAAAVVGPEKHWAVAMRGLAPVEILRSAPRPREHAAGDYGADGPWVAALALRAQFVRVPQTLYYKRRHDTGVTSTWRRDRATALALTDAYAEVLAEVQVGSWERRLLGAALAARRVAVGAGLAKAQFRLPGPGRRDTIAPSPTPGTRA